MDLWKTCPKTQWENPDKSYRHRPAKKLMNKFMRKSWLTSWVWICEKKTRPKNAWQDLEKNQARTCEKLISAIHEKIQTNHTGRPVKKFIKENSSENLDKPHRHKPVKKLVHSWENPNKSNRHEPVNKLVQNIFDKIPTNHSGTDLWKNVWKN